MKNQEQKLVQSPTLRTIRMVEDTLKKMDESLITVAELKRRLPKQVNHIALMEILEYPVENKKIYVSFKGITWIDYDSPKISEMIRKGREFIPHRKN
ncbi:MAG: hypothetical protein V1743_02460 [Nanoarchaeota archaeon]